MKPETILQVLKYSAIAIATGSVLWGMLFKLTYEDEAGVRRLTRGGKIAIGLLIAGFFVSVISNYLQEQSATRSAQTAAERDQQRTQEIIRSATPLQRLTVKWRFEQVPPHLRQKIQAPVEIPKEWSEKFDLLSNEEIYNVKPLLHRHYVLYPWLTTLEDGVRWAKTGPTVLLIALDESSTNVLPLGMLSLRKILDQDDDPKKAALRTTQAKSLASTVELMEELDAFFGKPLPERTRRCKLDAKLVNTSSAVSAEWNLDPGCIGKGIDRANASVNPVARLPEQITLKLFTRIDELPFNPGNFTEFDAGLDWVQTFHHPRRPRSNDFRRESSLELIPNGREADRVIYKIQYEGTEELKARGGGAEVLHQYGRLSLWEGKRQ